jgi:hypothetical protein
MYWVTGIGIGLLLIGGILIASGQITIFENQEFNENCGSIIGEGAQLFFDETRQSCEEVSALVQFSNVMLIVGIVLAVTGGVSVIYGVASGEKQRKTSFDRWD